MYKTWKPQKAVNQVHFEGSYFLNTHLISDPMDRCRKCEFIFFNWGHRGKRTKSLLCYPELHYLLQKTPTSSAPQQTCAPFTASFLNSEMSCEAKTMIWMLWKCTNQTVVLLHSLTVLGVWLVVFSSLPSPPPMSSTLQHHNVFFCY